MFDVRLSKVFKFIHVEKYQNVIEQSDKDFDLLRYPNCLVDQYADLQIFKNTGRMLKGLRFCKATTFYF